MKLVSGSNFSAQKGVVTIVTVVVLLIITSLAVFKLSASIVSEKQVVANEYRGLMAFEAAESGLAEGISEYRLKGEISTAIQSGALASGAEWRYWWDSDSESLRSVGLSDDGSVSRNMEMKITFTKFELPEAPVVAAAGATFSGNFDVTNLDGNLTVWSGGSVDMGGSFTTKVPHPIEEDVYITSSSSSYRGSDLIENDPNIGSLDDAEFQLAFLGSLVSDFCDETFIDQDGYANSTAFQAAIESAGSRVCIENSAGSITIPTGTDLGESPKTIIINGNWDQSAPNDFKGLVFVNGNVEKLNGSSSFRGSLIVNGNVDMGNGGPSMEFDVDYTANLGNTITASSVVGSWRDWVNE